jgi:hypothetical protein
VTVCAGGRVDISATCSTIDHCAPRDVAGSKPAGMIITDAAKAAAYTVKENEKVGGEPESVDR